MSNVVTTASAATTNTTTSSTAATSLTNASSSATQLYNNDVIGGVGEQNNLYRDYRPLPLYPPHTTMADTTMNTTINTNNNSNTTITNWHDDGGYTHELARRSVARAALHLGVRKCSAEVLDTLADVLLGFLERLGRSMAQSAEIGCRSSMHCNVLDAIDAAESNMCPAAFHMSFVPEEEEGGGVTATASATTDNKDVNAIAARATTTLSSGGVAGSCGMAANRDGGGNGIVENYGSNGSNGAMTAAISATEDGCDGSTNAGGGWESLAKFAFGPSWKDAAREVKRVRLSAWSIHASSSQHEETTGAPVGVAGTNGGGVAGEDGGVNGLSNSKKVGLKGGGWRAPYLDVVPAYPTIRRLKVATKTASSSAHFRLPVCLMDEACATDEDSDVYHSGEGDNVIASTAPQTENGEKKKAATVQQQLQEQRRRNKAMEAERRAIREMDSIPDESFFYWGSASAAAKAASSSSEMEKGGGTTAAASKSANGDGGVGVGAASQELREKKRPRLGSVDDATNAGAKDNDDDNNNDKSDYENVGIGYPMHRYHNNHPPGGAIPPFLPPFPPAYTYALALSAAAAAGGGTDSRRRGAALAADGYHGEEALLADTSDGRDGVRSGLVRLGRGSGALLNGVTHDKRIMDGLAVPGGPTTSSSASSTSAGGGGGSGGGGPSANVVPLVKPSGNRISKILEGSMDAVAP